MERGPIKFLLLWCGHLLVFIGVIGIFVPVLPTTPFILIASACYARSSDKFHRALYESKLFGGMLKNWQDTRSIAPRAKVIAVATIWIGIAISFSFITTRWVELVLLGIGAFISLFIITRANPPRTVSEDS